MKNIQFLRMRAEMKRQRFCDLCRKEGLNMNSILRVARHRVFDEDVLQEAPNPDPANITTSGQRAMQLAKDAVQLEYQAQALEPDAENQIRPGWWYIPSLQKYVEEERRQHRERKESGISEMDEILMNLGWKR